MHIHETGNSAQDHPLNPPQHNRVNPNHALPHQMIFICTGHQWTFRVSIPWWRHQMDSFSALLVFVRGIHRPPMNSPHKGQWRGALFFSLICAWINGWVNNREACDLRRHRTHYDVTVMICFNLGKVLLKLFVSCWCFSFGKHSTFKSILASLFHFLLS